MAPIRFPKAQKAGIGTVSMVLMIVLIVFRASTGNATPIPDSGIEGPPETKADVFVEGGAEFLAAPRFVSVQDVIRKLGRPTRTKSEKVKNPHDDSADTVYQVFYEGLQLEVYEVALHRVAYVTRIILTSRKYRVMWGLNVGVSKSQVERVLGQPTSSDDRSWTYTVSVGYEDDVIFYFQGDVVNKIVWRYIVD